jgi:hypothetical protein
VRDFIVEYAVWPDHHGKEVIEAKGGRHIEPIVVLEPDSDGMHD